jgi:hypothetical protein
VISATPSAIGRRSHGAVLLGERISVAVGPVRAGAPRVGEQHEREQPGDLAVVGQQRWTPRVSRIASA